MSWHDHVCLAAALGAALISGVFFAFSSFVMGALRRLDERHGIAAMQSINVVVINASFLGTFFGTAALAVVTVAGAWGEPGVGLRIAGAVLYVVGTVGVTIVGNVPLNDRLAGVSVGTVEAGALWQRYLVAWTRFNHVRTAAAAAAAVCFILALAN